MAVLFIRLPLKHWTIGILLLSFISIDLLMTGTFGAEAKLKDVKPVTKEDMATSGKVKCKEEIQEALKKQGDKEKGVYGADKIGSKVSFEEDHDEADDNDTDEDDDSQSDNCSRQECPDDEDTEEDTTTEVNTKDSKANPTGSKNPQGKLRNQDDRDETTENETEEDETDENVTNEEDTNEDNDEDDEDDETEEDVTQEQEKPKTPAKSAATTASKKPDPPKPDPRAKVVETKAKTPEPKVEVKKTTEKPVVKANVEPKVNPKKEEPKKEEPKKVVKQETVKKQEAIKKSEKKTDSAKKTTSKKRESEENDSVEEFKSRSQIEDILKLYEIGTKTDLDEQSLITSTFKDLKKIYESSIKPLEQMYKYKFISNRLISDADIFSKPLVLFLGAKSSGKTSLVNYLLGVESTPWQLRTGVSTSPQHFTIVEYGDNFSKLSPMEISADFAFSNLQQFGQHFLENHLEAFRMPLSILQKMTIVDSPGLVDGILNKAPEPGKSIDTEVYQWFVDRADIIFIVVESTQVHLTQSMKDLLEQLKGRDVRFIVSKSEVISQTQCVMLIGQLLWSLSPVMPSDKPPQVYALTTAPAEEYNPFLDLQEEEWLTDLAALISGVSRVESRAAAIRRHAVRVRNHAKVIDCYLGAYYRKKPLFCYGKTAQKLAKDITENPHSYNIFKGALAGITQNVSRYDLPDPDVYREFFRVNPLLDFNQLSATCSFFKGCPIDKLDVAIAYRLPDLVAKFKKAMNKDKKKSTTSTTTATGRAGGKK